MILVMDMAELIEVLEEMEKMGYSKLEALEVLKFRELERITGELENIKRALARK